MACHWGYHGVIRGVSWGYRLSSPGFGGNGLNTKQHGDIMGDKANLSEDVGQPRASISIAKMAIKQWILWYRICKHTHFGLSENYESTSNTKISWLIVIFSIYIIFLDMAGGSTGPKSLAVHKHGLLKAEFSPNSSPKNPAWVSSCRKWPP